jgi:predicted enzyme related to lactoylglutathione lyase
MPILAVMLKFETVAVVVRNEKRATKFWKDKLGFRVVTSFPHWVTVSAPGANVRLHLCPDSRPEKGNTGYMFMTKDAAKEEARLRKKGVKITKPVKKQEWGTIFWFADPDGNEFQVIEY